ncbi:hypothetical protein E3N88_23699 [Mikania micrantha]|uniref:Uncharacterized protein n=1 Tax=Mikania micrantha TaxID=192012 RepID=A0A5N6NGN9_9ASTR|nr:hypothetical protein E3N88_23699 [Mikania micrantha]
MSHENHPSIALKSILEKDKWCSKVIAAEHMKTNFQEREVVVAGEGVKEVIETTSIHRESQFNRHFSNLGLPDIRRDRPTMGLQEVGAYLKLDKTEAMLQPLTMHGEDFPPLSNLYDDGVYRNIHYNRPTMVHELGAYQTPDKRSNWFRPWLCQEDYFLHVSTSRNAVVLEHLGQHIMTFGQEKESHYVIAVADE